MAAGYPHPELLDTVAKLFGIRSQWLEACDDRIYDYLATYKEPRLLLDHLRDLWQQPEWRNTVGTPLRILTTAKRLDYRDDQRHELAPVLLERVADLGDETIYRYHIYQDGFSWDHPPPRIELKALGRTIWQALHIGPGRAGAVGREGIRPGAVATSGGAVAPPGEVDQDRGAGDDQPAIEGAERGGRRPESALRGSRERRPAPG